MCIYILIKIAAFVRTNVQFIKLINKDKNNVYSNSNV